MLVAVGVLSGVVGHQGTALGLIAATKSSGGGLSLGEILNPLFQGIAGALAFFYGLVPNYAVAIILLTLAIMVVLSPLTWKSTRSMIAMQRLAPEMKKLQQKYKGDKETLNREIMALYRREGASPAGGCLPMILQLPVWYVLYDVIRGLTNTVGPNHVPSPKYISHSSLLYHDLVASHGAMYSFGLDLSKTALSAGGGFLHSLPYWIIVIAGIGLQYLQMHRLTARNPQAASANSQTQAMQRFMPIIFGFIYIFFQAALNLYVLVSTLARLLQQELMYKYDPVVKAQMARLGGETAVSGAVGSGVVETSRANGQGDQGAQPGTLGGRLRQLLQGGGTSPSSEPKSGSGERPGGKGVSGTEDRAQLSAGGASRSNGRAKHRDGASRGAKAGSRGPSPASGAHSRSRDKRPRRAR